VQNKYEHITITKCGGGGGGKEKKFEAKQKEEMRN